MAPVEPDPASPSGSLDELLDKMRAEWDERARENARHFIANSNSDWTDEEFFESGRRNVAEQILNDPGNIYQGKDPKKMTVLEIGCGAGRITRALAEVFGEVYAVDVSGEMIAQAKSALADTPNAHVFQNNGTDLEVLGDMQVDFAFSFIVFQHIPSREVIYNYVREVHRLLRPGGLFKFQVQGADFTESGLNSWLGAHFSDEDAVKMAEECGFEARYRHCDAAQGSQYFWLWFFRKPQP
jgi:SAM-dependent methyltransferase